MSKLVAPTGDDLTGPSHQTSIEAEDVPPPVYSEQVAAGHQIYMNQWASRDPRQSSTQSLLPLESERDGRRTLLLIYIHGFMGNDTSFQSFPAHVHNLLTITLADTHVVHSKIYPRYKSRKEITVARDDFSKWLVSTLAPHESDTTDVILLGHSLGGILSAEVVLLQPAQPSGQELRHRILGTINFDVPFLGMHPGVIASGIGSLFRPAASPPTKPSLGPPPSTDSLQHLDSYPPENSLHQHQSNTLSPVSSSNLSSVSTLASPPTDLNFNPSFTNDVRIPVRKGWDNAIHFVTKHYSEGLAKASASYVGSTLQFGGCMADYPGLKRRYDRIRGLDDSGLQKPTPTSSSKTKVRFINYYTASSGISKKPRPAREETPSTLVPPGALSDKAHHSPSTSPRISISEHRDSGEIVTLPLPPDDPQITDETEPSTATPDIELFTLDSEPITPSQKDPAHINSFPLLPPIPPPPAEPPLLDVSKYSDKETRKLAEKDHARILKAYKQAVKDRNRAIRDREKALGKRRKREGKERGKEGKEFEAERKRIEAENKISVTVTPTAAAAAAEAQLMPTEEGKDRNKSKNKEKKRDRKFCVTPSKVNGVLDPAWVRVYMDGVDEVGAHCGLFFLNEAYERLVGDVGARIEEWVQDEDSIIEATRLGKAGRGEKS